MIACIDGSNYGANYVLDVLNKTKLLD